MIAQIKEVGWSLTLAHTKLAQCDSIIPGVRVRYELRSQKTPGPIRDRGESPGHAAILFALPYWRCPVQTEYAEQVAQSPVCCTTVLVILAYSINEPMASKEAPANTISGLM